MKRRLADLRQARVRQRREPRAGRRGNMNAVGAVLLRLRRKIQSDAWCVRVVGTVVAVGRGLGLWLLVVKSEASVVKKKTKLPMQSRSSVGARRQPGAAGGA